MNKYNDFWTRNKFIEYRKLKKCGYTNKMLIEHFGDDIYHSGIHNKNGATLPILLKYGKFMNEIVINPEKVDYSFTKQPSHFIANESDYIISFFSNDIPYIISLLYFPINDEETYNIIFTTRDQWNNYEYKLINFLKSGYLTDDQFKILEDIIGTETGLNDLFPIFRKISWILLDFCEKNLNVRKLSIGETDNYKKIKLYRNIIKNSFPNIEESEGNVGRYKYYIYEVK
jgi:hypothetical protein